MRNIPYNDLINWPIPNYTDPVTRGNGAFIINIVFLALTFPLVVLRIIARLQVRTRLGWDDFFCILALCISITFSVIVLLANYRYACNRHHWDVPFEFIEIDYQYAMASKALFVCGGAAIRQSLFSFYLRLVGDAGMKKFRFFVYAGMAFNLAIGVCFTFITIFQCTPVSAYWTYPPTGHCLDEGAITLSCGLIIMVCDFITVLLPIPIVLRLHMSWRQKIGVSFLLSLGLGASAAAAARCYYIWKALIATYDVTWWVYPLWIACSVELNVAIMASCAPATRPFLIKHCPWMIVPFSRIADLLSRLHHGKRDYSASSTTVVSEKHMSVYNTDHIESGRQDRDRVTSKSKGVYGDVSELNDGSSAEKLNAVLHSDSSIDKEEVLHAVSQAIKGVGPVPGTLFNESRRGSMDKRPSQESTHPRPHSVSGPLSEPDRARSRAGMASTTRPLSDRKVLRKSASGTRSPPHSSRPFEIFTQQSFELETSPVLSEHGNGTAVVGNASNIPITPPLNRNSSYQSADYKLYNAFGGYQEGLGNESIAAHDPSDSSVATRRGLPTAERSREPTVERQRSKRSARSADDHLARMSVASSDGEYEQEDFGMDSVHTASVRRDSSEFATARSASRQQAQIIRHFSGGAREIMHMPSGSRQESLQGFNVNQHADTLNHREPDTIDQRKSAVKIPRSVAGWRGDGPLALYNPATTNFRPIVDFRQPSSGTENMPGKILEQDGQNERQWRHEETNVSASGKASQIPRQSFPSQDQEEGWIPIARQSSFPTRTNSATSLSRIPTKADPTFNGNPASTAVPAVKSVHQQHRTMPSTDSQTSSVRDSRATFLLDDSVNDSVEGREDVSEFEAERLARERERRRQMVGLRRLQQ